MSKRYAIIPALALLPAMAQPHPPPPEGFRWVNPLPKTVPARVHHKTYFSKIHNAEIGYAIYLPAAYATGAARFPVIYYLHGGRPGSEAKSVAMAAQFDAHIVAGEAPPMIYVFSNGGAVSHYDYPAYNSYGERTLIAELIPHIDQTYRTIANWTGRGIEGFSQGGRGSARIAFAHPELFCSAAPFGGGHQYERHVHEHNGQEGAPSNYLFAPKWNTYDLARGYAARREHKPELMIAVGTEDQNYQPNLHWMAYLDSLGVTYSKHIVPGVKHDARGVYRHLGPQSMQFHAKCFAARANVAK